MTVPCTRSHAQGEVVGDLSAMVRMVLTNTASIRLSCPNIDGSERHLVVTDYDAYATIAYRSYFSQRNDLTGEYSQVVVTQTFVVVFDYDQCVYATDSEIVLNNTVPESGLSRSQIRRILRIAKRGGTLPQGIFQASKPQVDQIFDDLSFWMP